MVTSAHRYFFVLHAVCSGMQVLLGFDLQINLALSERLNGNCIFIFCVNVNFRSNKKLDYLDFLFEGEIQRPIK